MSRQLAARTESAARVVPIDLDAVKYAVGLGKDRAGHRNRPEEGYRRDRRAARERSFGAEAIWVGLIDGVPWLQ